MVIAGDGTGGAKSHAGVQPMLGTSGSDTKQQMGMAREWYKTRRRTGFSLVISVSTQKGKCSRSNNNSNRP